MVCTCTDDDGKDMVYTSWDGPDDDTTVIVEDIQSPLSEPQAVLAALLADLSGPSDSSTEENNWI